jgi:hypothetical protein
MDQNGNSAAAASAAVAGVAHIVGTLFGIALLIFHVVVYWRIASKAGYNGALALLVIIPLVNIVPMCMFAFSRWPLEERLDASIKLNANLKAL